MSTATALNNGLNLAYWLYRVQPGLFKALIPVAQQARGLGRVSKLSRLGQLGDDGDLFSTGDTFDAGDNGSSLVAPTYGVTDTTPSISPDLTAMPDPVLTSVDIAAPDISPDVTASINAAAAAPTSSSTSTPSALSSVGSFLASATGLTALTNLATAALKAGTVQSATVGTQVARVANGAAPAAITYGYNSAGQLVPILTSASGVNQALTPSSLASLVTPSTLSSLVIPIGIVLLLAAAASKGS